MFKGKKILALGAHPDDVEFSCGGSIHKLSKDNNEIFYAAFSPCVISLPDNLEKDILFKEMKRASVKIGIKQENLFTYNFPVRNFLFHRQEILEELILLRKKIQPDIVFLHRSTDIHQDHSVIHKEGLRAFKNSTILGYELPWNDIETVNNFFIKLEKEDIDHKVQAIEEYKSQSFRSYKSSDFYYSLAKVRGTQISSEYAEAFELVRGIY